MTGDTNKARAFQAEVRQLYSTDMAAGQQISASFLHHREIVQAELSKELPEGSYASARLMPACRYLDSLLSTASHPVFAGLIAAIQALAPHIYWKTNENYRHVFSDHFFENESFCEIIGPGGLLTSQNMRAGLLLLGEEVDYPAHKHEATEWYHVLNGAGLWQQGENDYQLRKPGSVVFHSEWQTHAMRCNDQAVLALWSWSGGIGVEAIVDK
ncbi:MAG: cupin domain-containing protein [Gammaproteobacteria bacterium]|nr:cupin domain-containing protein [Gammaproteobacteria bacterium]